MKPIALVKRYIREAGLQGKIPQGKIGSGFSCAADCDKIEKITHHRERNTKR